MCVFSEFGLTPSAHESWVRCSQSEPLNWRHTSTLLSAGACARTGGRTGRSQRGIRALTARDPEDRPRGARLLSESLAGHPAPAEAEPPITSKNLAK